MSSPSKANALGDIRLAHLKEASEKRDVAALMSWYSKDATFTNVAQNRTIEGWDNIYQFYARAYETIPTFTIQPVKATCPTPEFVASEMTCEGEVGADLPQLGLKAGDTMKLKGVSLFWWRWEGEGDEWNGDLADDVVRGWKIVSERAYFLPG